VKGFWHLARVWRRKGWGKTHLVGGGEKLRHSWCCRKDRQVVDGGNYGLGVAAKLAKVVAKKGERKN
jgi:hypothetical protein